MFSERAEDVLGYGPADFSAAQERDGAEFRVDCVRRELRFKADAVARFVGAVQESARVELERRPVCPRRERDAALSACQDGEGAQAAVIALDIKAVVIVPFNRAVL